MRWVNIKQQDILKEQDLNVLGKLLNYSLISNTGKTSELIIYWQCNLVSKLETNYSKKLHSVYTMGPKTLCNLQCEYTKDLATLWCNNSSKHNGLKLFLKLHSHFRAFFTRFLYTFHTRGIFMLPLRKCWAGSFEYSVISILP